MAAPGSEVVLLELETLNATNHNGGAIHFGHDGKLFIAVGENANRALAQSVDTRLGKLLRMNADGSIPADNPATFMVVNNGVSSVVTPTGANRAIWALGLRNPFSFAVQPGTGDIFINDVGELTWEHITALVDDVVTVTEDSLLEAMRTLATRSRLVAEPSGATATAAYLTHRDRLPDGPVVAVVSGGNVPPDLLARALRG